MILYYTDIQIDRYSRFDMKTKSGYGLRLDNIIECANWIAEEIRTRKPKIVVNGGDTNNSIGVVSSEALSAIGKCMSIINKACEDVGAEHMILLGNHDMGILSNTVTSVDHLEYLSDITLVTEPCEFLIGDKKFGMVPFSHDTNYSRSALLTLQANGCGMAFTHLDFNGFKFNTVKSSECDMQPTEFADSFKIINGHYHIYQEIGNVLCPGSCIQHKYSEYSEKRGILWIGEDSIPELIPNLVSPVLKKVNSIKQLQESDLPDSSYVYIDYNPLVDKTEDVEKTMERFARSIINMSSSSISMKSLGTKIEGDSPKELFQNFIQNNYETELDKSKLEKLGLTQLT